MMIRTKKNEKGRKREASPWLRCLAALMKILYDRESYSPPSSFFKPYIQSLPPTFDTISTSWSTNEIKSYLRGTALGKLASSDRVIQSKDNDDDDKKRNILQTKYRQMIQPYLNFVGVNTTTKDNKWKHDGKKVSSQNDDDDDNDDHGYNLFLYASACLSTRGFHLSQQQKNDEKGNNCNNETYTGPYLLPLIDLLNHASSSTAASAACPNQNQKCTTLQKDINTKSFYMQAERTIQPNEVIRHSYYGNHNNNGNCDLNSSQLLQTFGFVTDENMILQATSLSSSSTSSFTSFSTPLIKSSLDDTHVLKRKRQEYDDTHKTAIRSSINNMITPASLSKSEIIKACRDVASSDYPQIVREQMENRRRSRRRHKVHCQNDDDDYDEEDMPWEIPPPSILDDRNDLLNSLVPGNDILLSNQPDQQEYNVLNNEELITTCVFQFLPIDVYNEYYSSNSGISAALDDNYNESCMLDIQLLEDYFLGKLVTKSILKVIKQAWMLYLPDSRTTTAAIAEKETKEDAKTKEELFSYRGSIKKDQTLLHWLLQKSNILTLSFDHRKKKKINDDANENKTERENKDSLAQLQKSSNKHGASFDVDEKNNDNCDISFGSAASIRRKMYGLTISLEERLSLLALREEVLIFIDFLDDSDD
mmetsp:Transcript_27270/g.39946  ORF Transcript_27270/g.39946 Transcript_27270/m.39946 type:complete len:648 (-) Transcript_27270:729-2672(-)